MLFIVIIFANITNYFKLHNRDTDKLTNSIGSRYRSRGINRIVCEIILILIRRILYFTRINTRMLFSSAISWRMALSYSTSIFAVCPFSIRSLPFVIISKLFTSLFRFPENYVRVIRFLFTKRCGYTRDAIAKHLGVETGGTLSTVLEALEESDFIRCSNQECVAYGRGKDRTEPIHPARYGRPQRCAMRSGH